MEPLNTSHIISTRVVVEHQGEIAILQRIQTGELAGSWELPGGKMDPGETILDAALREAEEETGLIVDPINLQPLEIEHRIISDGKHRGKQYRAFGIVATASSKFVTVQPSEHTTHRWLSPTEALKMRTLSAVSHRTIIKLGPLLGLRPQY